MKLIAQVDQRLHASLSVVSVFQYPTIEQMAEVVTLHRAESAGSPTLEEAEFEEGAIGDGDHRAFGTAGA